MSFSHGPSAVKYDRVRTDELWVVAVISNPVRYKSRYALYKEFETRVLAAGANLMTVELALGGRDFEVTQDGHHRHLQLRARDELWHKENLINLGVQNLPESWRYVAWIDADVQFVRPDWPAEIVHQLQHYKVIQCFQDALDLGPTGEVVQQHRGFAWSYATGRPEGKGYYHWHPGYAWAMRRQTWDDLGGLIDGAVLGAADHHMAWALLDRVIERSPPQITPGYKRMLETWQDRARVHVRGDLGYMPGTILHSWHGKKRDRRYGERWQILHDHKFDPDFDLQRDWQGVLQLSHAGERMRNSLRGYFRARHEDSIDLD